MKANEAPEGIWWLLTDILESIELKEVDLEDAHAATPAF